MDYLPEPIDHAHIIVPFYADQKIYYPGQFFELPKPMNPDILMFVRTGLDKGSVKNDTNGFLQTWLFFALLAQVLGEPIDAGSFYRGTDHSVHTEELSDILKRWQVRDAELARKDPLEYQKRYLSASLALQYARRFVAKHLCLGGIDQHQASNDPQLKRGLKEPYNRVSPELILSIAVLGETLQSSQPRFPISNEEHRLSFYHDQSSKAASWGYSHLIRETMLKNGWCPTQIRMAESVSGNGTTYYRSFIEPPNIKEDHTSCTANICTAPRLEHLHMAEHTRQCQSPERNIYVSLSESELVATIDAGRIPLATLGPGSGELKLVEFDFRSEDMTFGAFSHSWYQGLLNCGTDARGGNDRRMLLCQVRRAQKACNELFRDREGAEGKKDVPFWIDVLCMPRSGRVRAAAVNQLKDIFSRAKGVIIWDRKLLNMRRPSNMIALNMLIRSSAYSQRLWTMLEAILAKELYIELEDALVSIQKLIKACETAREDLDDKFHYIWWAGHPFSWSIWKLRLHVHGKGTKAYNPVQLAWEAVQFRSLAEPADETSVLASVLGLDVAELESIGPAETSFAQTNDTKKRISAQRMVRFLHLLHRDPKLGVPSGIIFLPGPSLRDESIPETQDYGWAPRTWLSRQDQASPLTRPQQDTAIIMKDGLLVKFPGLLLRCPREPPRRSRFWVPVDESMHKWYKVTVDLSDEDWQAMYRTQISLHGELQPAIIMSSRSPRERWDNGVLVRHKDKNLMLAGKVRWVEILCRVWLRLEANASIIKQCVERVHEDPGSVVFADRLDERQKWCVWGNCMEEQKCNGEVDDSDF